MAALRGEVQAERGAVSRLGHHEIEARLETWRGQIKTVLYKDGTFVVYLGDKGHACVRVCEGNVNDGERYATYPGTDGGDGDIIIYEEG